jgi:hypothetical protein
MQENGVRFLLLIDIEMQTISTEYMLPAISRVLRISSIGFQLS